jgi:glycerol-3-phosphate dehydrogenase
MNDKQLNFDLIILGAGISGLGLALTAIERGHSVCLLEKGRIAQSTSNNSLRIIHGGLRYLQKFDFPRVFESAADQAYCLNTWPDLIQALDCVLPLSGKGLKKASLAKIASLLYSAILTLSNSPLKGPSVSRKLESNLEEIFISHKVQGFLNWTDALILDPQSLASNIKQKLESDACVVKENSEVVSYSQSATEVRVDFLDSNGSSNSISSRALACCLGPQANSFNKVFNCSWAIAFNLILNKQYSNRSAFSCDGQEGRHFFFVPRGEQTALGTDYYQVQDPTQVEPPSQERVADFILSASNSLPNLNLAEQDLSSIEWGVLPVKGFKSKNSPHFYGASIIEADKRVVHILATKYTGFRSQALKALKLIEDKLCV